MNKKYEKVERFLGRIFISVIVFIVVFLVVDKISLFFISPITKYDQKYGPHMILKPYVMHGGRPNFHYTRGKTQHNALGYRGDEPVMPKPAGEYRIFVVGGSTVYSGNPSLPQALQARFDKAGLHNVKIYNFGLSGLLSGESLARIVFEISELSPNYIVMYNGANDILQPLKADPRPGYPRDFFVLENNPLLIQGLKEYPRYALLAFGFNLPRHFLRPYFIERFANRRKVADSVNYLQNSWRAEIAETYIKNIVKASVVSEAFGAEFTAFFQPVLYFKKNLSEEEQIMINDLSITRAHALITRSGILRGIKRYPQYEKFVDVSNIFDNHPETVFVDDFHIKDEKNAVVAEYIFNNILPKIISRLKQ